MKETMEKLIQSDIPEDWLIAYYLILEEYGSLDKYEGGEEMQLYRGFGARLHKITKIAENTWNIVHDNQEPFSKPKYIIIPELKHLR